MWKLRYRKSKLFACGFRPIKQQSQGLNVPSLFPQSVCNLLKQYKTLESSNWSMAFNCGYRNQTQFFLASASWKFGAVSRPSAVGLSDQAFSPSCWSSLLYHLDLFKDCKKCQRTSGLDKHRLYYHTLWCPLDALLLWMIDLLPSCLSLLSLLPAPSQPQALLAVSNICASGPSNTFYPLLGMLQP